MYILNSIVINLDSTNIWIALLSFIPALINISILAFCYFKSDKNKLTRAFSFFIFFLIVWQIQDTLLRISGDTETANMFYRTILFGVLFCVPSGIHFSLIFFDKIKKSAYKIIISVLYLPSLIFTLINLFNLNEIKLINGIFGYANSVISLNENFQRIWLSILAITTVGLLFYYYKNVPKENTKKKKRALLILIGYSIPSTQAIITQALIPVIYNTAEIPLTSTFITFFSIASIVALRKYNLFEYSPAKVSQQILDTMTDGVIISDKEGKIKFANIAICEMLNYKVEGLLNKSIYYIITEDQHAEVSKTINSRYKGEKSQYETKMKTNDGKIINVLISASSFFNNNNEMTGSLGIVTDITSIKNQNKIRLLAILEGEETERKRLAQELHDGIAQYLSAINMNLLSINGNLSAENKKTLKIIKKITKDTIIETRALAHNLLPKGIEQDLISSFKHLLKTFNSINSILFSLKINGEIFLLSESLKINLFRITQEFINNSIKHSSAKKVNITINFNVNTIELLLSDDGVGFKIDNLKNNSGIGLVNITNRVNAINGLLKINSSSKMGTLFKITITSPL